MAVQAFVDDSGGAGHAKHFVLAGLLADAESWASFSEEWSACLAETPSVGLFKMREAASLSGAFRRWTVGQRDDKLRALARIINRHARIAMWSVVNIEAHAERWAKLPKPQHEIYFWPFQTLIMGACFELWDLGCRERFEIIFDEHVIFGPRAKRWYPLIREVVRHMEPDAYSIMPVDPIFRTDDEFMPIQAADLFAWCLRRNTDNPDERAFEWLLAEMSDVQQSDYSGYFDIDRMQGIREKTRAIVTSGEIPQVLVDLYRQINEDV